MDSLEHINQHFVSDTALNPEPTKFLKHWGDVMVLWCLSYNPGTEVLPTLYLIEEGAV